MREILFRGKSKDNGAWVYGSYISPPDTAFIVGWNTKKSEMTYDAVIPETVGQYTGLKDENSVKIFERDIVRDKDGNKDGPCDEADYHEYWAAVRYEVFYDIEDGSFRSRADVDKQKGKTKGKRKSENYTDRGLTSYGIKIDRLIIIGNIHDNPELLQMEKNKERSKKDDRQRKN
jgi:uncharacterized phage protein (TIGR01671 family)